MGQKNQLWWDLPAGDSFQLHREIYSLPADAFNRTLGALTELFGVKELTRQPVRELSLGERMKMELIAALLHEPQLLLLDEPTIGLDVVAQVAIQHCLKEYNATRGVTMLLTSHYMRDVEALCSRVLVIAHGRVIYDGLLAGITERFGRSKLVRLQFAGEETPADFGRFGEYTSIGAGRRAEGGPHRAWRKCWPAILDRYTVVDMSVQDPPLDQVIARVFEEGRASGMRPLPPSENNPIREMLCSEWRITLIWCSGIADSGRDRLVDGRRFGRRLIPGSSRQEPRRFARRVRHLISDDGLRRGEPEERTNARAERNVLWHPGGRIGRSLADGEGDRQQRGEEESQHRDGM